MVSHVQYWCNGIHAHSMGVQGLFPLTHWAHAYSQAFRRCSICLQSVHVTEGPRNTFSNSERTQRPYKLALNFHWMSFLHLCQARRHDVTLEYMNCRWSRCPPMRLATKSKKVLQQFRKIDKC
jgi:hypothetical protein